ncbi:MAG: TonB-dependent receptor [Chlorobi bacterium]|nr:TonB-dependent receptor [Chlorobiota bacterium]
MQKVSLILFLLFFALTTYAQNNITGVVTDAKTGETLPGVNVHIKGTTKGTITDINGKYTIVASDNDILVFSFVGYTTKEIAVGNQTVINVALEGESLGLNEVVVVGYGTQKKSDLTGAISVVDMKEMQTRQVSTIDQALQGQVAGVDVTTNSGTPGGGVMVRIRGIGTLNDANPLFVVDGMMVDNIDFLNTSDIESMQVLKDASATAIYGSRGANGVVIITTKKGSKNKEAQISFNAYYGVQNFWRRAPLCNSEQWAILNNEAQNAALKPPYPGLADPKSLPYTDWFDEISNKNAPIESYDLSISGGNEKNTYYLSGSYLDQEGIVDKSDFTRGSFRANGTHQPKKWLTIGENVTLVRTEQNQVLEGDEWNNILISAMNMDPVSPVYNPDGTFAEGIYNDINNPVARLHYTNDVYTNYQTLANIYADIKFLNNFNFKTSYNLEYTFGTSDYFEPQFYVSPVFQNQQSTIGKYHDSNFTSQWSNTLTYNNTFNDTHNLTVLIGEELYSFRSEWDGITANNVPTDDPAIRYIDNATGATSAVTYGSAYEVKQVSYMARVNYDYKGKYLFTGNFRADASSKFSKKNQWGYFPSFSAGWRLTEENFLKDISWLYNLKLRVGWGQIGNQGSVPAYQNVTTASTGMNYTWSTTENGDGAYFVPGSAFTSSGNDEIKWETSTTTNIGVDFGLFDGKLNGTFEYFNKVTSDMLLQVPVPGQAGLQEAPWQNAGEMKNNGVEFSLNYSNRNHEFKYSIGLIMSHINNEVTSLGNGNEFIDGAPFRGNAYLTRTVVGKPIAQFYMYKTDGLFQNWDEVNAQTAQTGVAPGDVRYVDEDNDGNLDFFFVGSPLPDFTYSFNTSFEYKGFDLTMNFQGVSGNKIFNAAAWYNRSSSAYWNLDVDMLDRWTGEGSTNDARHPRMNAMDVNNAMMSDRFLEDGSYLRFKTLQIGYTIPVKKHINKLRIYFNAQNLYTFTKYTGLDPEIGTGYTGGLDIGIDRANYPQARLMSFGVNLIF